MGSAVLVVVCLWDVCAAYASPVSMDSNGCMFGACLVHVWRIRIRPPWLPLTVAGWLGCRPRQGEKRGANWQAFGVVGVGGGVVVGGQRMPKVDQASLG